MKKIYILTLAFLVMTGNHAFSQKAAQHQKDAERSKLVDYRIDNNGYWKMLASKGLATLNPVIPVQSAVYVGSDIRAFSVITEDSPDVAVAENNSTQSENSVFVDPNDNLFILNSNNSTPNPSTGDIYGADALLSADAGLTWGGTIYGPGGSNWGDPAAAIGQDGAYYIGAITSGWGQQVSKSTDQGATYTVHSVDYGTLDKNHLWIDNVATSPYTNYLYDAWTDFDASSNIALSRSTNGGESWSSPVNVSSGVNAGGWCQGVNINSGPNGEVYVVFAIYDNPNLDDESSIGIARSFDGGATWEPATRIIDNIRGIRVTDVNKYMRKNSFPSMAVDISGGEYDGNIYVVWPNVGVPGVNTGNDVDVYMIRSEDQGETWSAPVKINQDPSGLGRKHYFPWITCDPANGILSTVFYDDRNVGSNQCEVYCANSYDGGETWEDFKVSDVAFTPSPIPNMADGYFGDYLGITALDGMVYPCWTDNRTGAAMTYVSPYETNPLSKPMDLTAEVTFETGIVDLQWRYNDVPGFSYFKIYRDNDSIGMAYDTVYSDQLPDYGVFVYKVTAKYTDGGESSASKATVQWGDAQISVNPAEISEILMPESSVTKMVTISNIGQLEMNYNISLFVPVKGVKAPLAYCEASGGCDEFISRVQLNEIDNISTCNGYEDFTILSTTMAVGNTYEITVTNGNTSYPSDECGLWVDWNQNEAFDDNEEIAMNGTPGVGPYTATIIPPVGSTPGMTRLRARIVYSETPEPCGESSWGEVEDYSIYVQSWLIADPLEGTIPAGEDMEIAVTLSSVDMELGTYTAEMNVFSNDPDNPEVTVPITMIVAEVGVNISGQEEICLGESVQLTTDVIGGSGLYTYTWTSLPEGFNSNEADVTVTPNVTTTYFVEVFDGTMTLSDEITITVNPLPEISLGEDISVCQGETRILDAGAGFKAYLWSNGETSQSIEVSETGTYWVEVTNDFDCVKRDTLVFTVNLLPAVNLGQDHAFCEGTPEMLSAGIGFASYLWSTGETSYYINVTVPGEYWVVVADEIGCSNQDTIVLTMNPKPTVSIGDDQTFCEGTTVTLSAGSGFSAYLWDTGETTSSISIGVPGEHWVQVTDGNGCTNQDAVVLTMDPLPVAPAVNSGPVSVDNYQNQTSDFGSTTSNYAISYEWKLTPAEAGSISGNGTSAQVTWSTGFTGPANISVKGINACGSGNFSPAYAVTVYSSQGIDDKNAVSGIKLFPNPNDGAFVLQLNSRDEQELKFQITTSGGNMILDSKENIPAGLYRKNFNLGNLPGGTYYLVIRDSQGRMLSRQQIVIQ
jgi:hypothetical protein